MGTRARNAQEADDGVREVFTRPGPIAPQGSEEVGAC